MKFFAIRSSWFDNLSPRDGLFALFIGLLFPFYIYFISSFGFDKGLMQTTQRSYVEIIYLTFVFIILALVILIFVKVRGQDLESTGLSWGRFTRKEKIVMCSIMDCIIFPTWQQQRGSMGLAIFIFGSWIYGRVFI